MNLLVNVTPLQASLTGIGRYTRELLARLLRDPEVTDIAGFSDVCHYQRPALQALVDHADTVTANGRELPRTARASPVEAIYAAVKPLARNIPYARKVRDGIQRRRLQRTRLKYQQYVYWEPNFVLQPLDGIKIATVHDLSHLRYPQFHPPERVRWLQAGLEKTLSEASRVMTVSAFGKQELQQILGVAPDRIAVVPPGISDCFLTVCSPPALTEFRHRYGLPDKYILSVGTQEPRKNVKGLIEAHQRLPGALRKRYPLVLAGCRGWQHGQMDSIIRRLVAKGEIKRLGFVPQQDLPALYQSASLFTYVSLYEGFGMPVIEAMASGIPVITSDRASMPEAAGGYGTLVNPEDNDSITGALRDVLEAGSVADEAGLAAASAAARRYTWASSADKLKAVVEEVG